MKATEGNKKDKNIGLRVNSELVAKLSTIAAQQGWSVSHLIRKVLFKFVEMTAAKST